MDAVAMQEKEMNMKTRLVRWAMCGVAALAAGCGEQFQRHDPDAATADVVGADAARDAGSSRLMGVDPEPSPHFLP